MTLFDVVSAVLLLSGGCLSLLAAVGLLRFPDTVSRLHASAKAQTVGLLLILVGTAIQLAPSQGLLLMLVAGFQLLTTPVTGHIIGRIAHRTGAVDRPALMVDQLGERLLPTEESGEGPPGDGHLG